MATYHVGDRVRCTGTIKDRTPAEIDPSSVYGWYKSPRGTVVTYQYGVDGECVRTDTGDYYIDVDITEHGTWRYGFYSTGTGKAASEDGIIAVARTVRSS